MITPAAACLAMAIYFEARGEPELGQYAVAEVVVNREEDPAFPDTVCAVISEDRGPLSYDCQFSFMCDGKSDFIPSSAARDRAERIAAEVLAGGTDYAKGATYFHAGSAPSWARVFNLVAEYGAHKFYSP